MYDRPRTFIGIRRTLIPGCDTCNVAIEPLIHDAFQPTHLIIPKEIAINFEILAILVGKTSQFISNDPIPASTFGGDVVVLRDQVVNVMNDLPLSMKFNVVRPGESINLVVRNLYPCALNFFGAVAGEVMGDLISDVPLTRAY